MPGLGDVVVVVGPPVVVLTSRGAVVVVLSTGSPAGAAGVRVAELLLLASTMTCCPCLLRLGPLLQHCVPTGMPQKVRFWIKSVLLENEMVVRTKRNKGLTCLARLLSMRLIASGCLGVQVLAAAAAAALAVAYIMFWSW
ncbi:hypothetical protein VPH35_068799 [Triticum aestivum]|uniref:uncharacterized protein n=1 Tax=Triticum aestivum TaxID=4565 RepID=UPI001D0089AC|nr:uncharacterized protein LOC123087895 [Triticum aestivum]XP_044365950.1 uncharacterized protein LOC123087895 [Triticum aestivum]